MVLQAVCTIEWDIFFFSSLKMISHLFGGQFDLDIYHCAIRHFWWIAWYSWSDTMVMFWGCRRPGFERTCGSSRKGSEVGYPSRKTFIYIFSDNLSQTDARLTWITNNTTIMIMTCRDDWYIGMTCIIYIYVYIIFSIFNIHIIEDIWYMIVHDSILCIYILYDWYITYISIHRSIYLYISYAHLTNEFRSGNEPPKVHGAQLASAEPRGVFRPLNAGGWWFRNPKAAKHRLDV